MRESTLWFIDVIAILALVVTASIHIFPFSTYLSGMGLERALSPGEIVNRARNPLYLAAYLVLLCSISYHSSYRLRLVLCEYFGRTERARRIISVLCLLAGLFILIVGLYSTIATFLG